MNWAHQNKKFCPSKDTVQRIKDKPQAERKYMQIISDKEYIFRIIDNWLLKLNNDKNKQLNIINEQRFDGHFTKDEIWMANN